MTFNDIMKESWLSISGNKLRSFLTVLGIIIGVMAAMMPRCHPPPQGCEGIGA